jgi:membrane fusion protein (multidrug efflux system)
MRISHFIPLSLALVALPGCHRKAAVAAPGAMPPAAVSVTTVTSEPVTITRDLPGRIDAVRMAEVRARVSGILLERTFKEGADVKAGQVLFKIDPAPLEAARDSAIAALAKAEANLQQAKTQASRYGELVNIKAVSRQDYDNALAAAKSGEAEVLSSQAAVKTADLNLGYATVTAPIDGRIGKAQVTEGALVGQTDATKLAIIQQLDPIYIDFTQSSTDLLALKKALQEGSIGKVSDAQAKAVLLLEDGSEYPHKGALLFSEVSVDETTGMVSLRAQFPNPDRLLLPGMFARVRIAQAIRNDAITVPQRAVTRTQGGTGSVLVVDEQNKVELRMIRTDVAVGDKWVVTQGLKPGERVIMEGHLKARPGGTVVPEPFVRKEAAAGNRPPASQG